MSKNCKIKPIIMQCFLKILLIFVSVIIMFFSSYYSQISIFTADGSGASKFCTTGVDGRLVIWNCKVSTWACS